jgi:hypothetical protein
LSNLCFSEMDIISDIWYLAKQGEVPDVWCLIAEEERLNEQRTILTPSCLVQLEDVLETVRYHPLPAALRTAVLDESCYISPRTTLFLKVDKRDTLRSSARSFAKTIHGMCQKTSRHKRKPHHVGGWI